MNDSLRKGLLYIWLPAGIVGLIVFLAYIPSLENSFVHWDDQQYIYENPGLLSFAFDSKSLKSLFTEFAIANWHPLTLFSFAIDYKVWGLDPFGFHLTNIIFHAMNTSLVFLLTTALLNHGLNKPMEFADKDLAGQQIQTLYISVISSLLFGLHPLHVESVAWISERKDVLSVFFYTLSVISYLKYAEKLTTRRFYYVFSLVLFALALLSKPMAISLPPVLFILDIFILKRGLLIKEKAPFIAFSLVSAYMTIWAQRFGGAVVSIKSLSFFSRLGYAIHAYIFYITKTIAPIGLSPFYPFPFKGGFLNITFITSIVAFCLIMLYCLSQVRKHNVFPAVWLYYIITLIPVIGLVQVGTQFAADRYMYLPSIGPFILAGIGGGFIRARFGRRVFYPLFITLFLALTVLTIKQQAVWKDTITLWTQEIRIYGRDTVIGYKQRASAYISKADYNKAIEDYNTAIRFFPDYPDTYVNRGLVMHDLGHLNEAMKDLDKAISLNPENARAYNTRGNVYNSLGEYNKAIKDFDSAIAFKPLMHEAYNNRANAYKGLKDYRRAILDYEKAARLRPDIAAIRYNLSKAYELAGDKPNASMSMKEAERLGFKAGTNRD